MSTLEVERLAYHRVAAPLPRDATSRNAKQFWDIVDPDGKVVAHAEIFEKADQWGVRLFDRAPSLDENDLARIVARLLVWHAHCPMETVELWLERTKTIQTMVRVSGDYV
jgi:uncharacterized protein YcgI (DUF1989 family)